MASTLMHMAVSEQLYKKLNQKLNINYYDYMLGSIAPDISKIIGETKEVSHFLDNNKDIPNTKEFLKKYSKKLNNSFNLGYFIHLYTDKLFYRDYYPLFIEDDFFNSIIRSLDGKVLRVSAEKRDDILYNDYTNLNIQLIDEYGINLDIFYNEFIVPKTTLTEIPVRKLNLLLENASILIQNLGKEKEQIIDITSIKSFIDDCVEEIYTKLLSLNLF